jgi:hypothetical protein
MDGSKPSLPIGESKRRVSRRAAKLTPDRLVGTLVVCDRVLRLDQPLATAQRSISPTFVSAQGSPLRSRNYKQLREE